MKTLLAILTALFAAAAGAQTYPAKPIRIIVGFPPGGGTDIVARLIGQKLTESWGQQAIVDNRPGATGMIGAQAIAKAQPDGYTLGIGHVNSQAIAPSIAAKPLYDPIADFSPIAYVGYVPNVLVVHPSTPARTVKELIALAKARPGQITFASPGVGSTNHLAGEMLRIGAGIDIVHVPYKGSGPAIADLLGGHVVMNYDAMSSVVTYVKEGRMRPLAVTTPQRDPQLPNVPTMRETLPVFKDFEVTNWYSVVGPAGLPRDLVTKLNAEVNRIIAIKDVAAKLDELGVRRNPMTPEKFGEFIKAENVKYRKIAKESGVRME
jgi:tripartite-type tricarboxylate transporter receptor subunit TctC